MFNRAAHLCPEANLIDLRLNFFVLKLKHLRFIRTKYNLLLYYTHRSVNRQKLSNILTLLLYVNCQS